MEAKLQQHSGEPLYLRVTAELREQLKSGQLKPGDRLPTFADWLAQHGIHKNTIERAHLLLEQEGLIVRERGRGTFAAFPPPRARRQQPELIGFCGMEFLLTRSSSTFWMRVLEGIHAAMNHEATHREAGSHAVSPVSNAPLSNLPLSNLPLSTPQLLLLQQVEENLPDRLSGVLLNGLYVAPLQRWHDEKWPCVSLLAPSQTAETSSVMADNYAGAREATQHLIDLGHRRIAYLHSCKPHSLVPHRMAGYRNALQSAGIEWNARWAREASRIAPLTHLHRMGLEEMRAWLVADWKELGCTAILAHNDEVAVGIIKALNEAGFTVPGDVSVVGFDGTEVSEYSHPSLTTVEVPLREIGRRGMELLSSYIENGIREFDHITLPTTLRVRASTAPPSG